MSKKEWTRAEIDKVMEKFELGAYRIELLDWAEDVMSVGAVVNGKTLAAGVGKTPQAATAKLGDNLEIELKAHEARKREQEIKRWRDRQPDVK